jgi:hypothetical protein
VHVVWQDRREGNWELYYKRSTDGGFNWGAETRLTFATGDRNQPAIAVSGSVVHVVWADNSRDVNSPSEIYYKRSTDGGVSWEADTQLTTSDSYSSFLSSVSVSGSIVHVVWQDDRDLNQEIYYKRSPDGGVSWEADTRLTSDPSSQAYPSVAVSGSVVHVVWQDDRDGSFKLFYKRSTDGGVSWGADTRLTNNSRGSSSPSVSVSGQAVHIVWVDQRNVDFEIFYKRSTDGGTSWEADTRLTISAGESSNASVAVSDSVVHVVWQDNRDGNYEIYHKRAFGGNPPPVQIGPDVRLTNDPSASKTSDNNAWCIAASGDTVHVVWYDFRDANFEIYYKRSTDGGTSWGADTWLTTNSAESSSPSVTASGSVVHVVWQDRRDGSGGEIYYKRSTDGGVIWEADTRLTNNSRFKGFPSMAVSDSVVYVVWRDLRDTGGGEIYYKRSTDGGVSWEADIRLTNNSALKGLPSVAVSGSVVHVVWHDHRDNRQEI